LFRICCIFLAAKVEEHYSRFVHLGDLFKIYGGYGDTEVMAAEIKLIEVRMMTEICVLCF
jgi:hypothetical protein